MKKIFTLAAIVAVFATTMQIVSAESVEGVYTQESSELYVSEMLMGEAISVEAAESDIAATEEVAASQTIESNSLEVSNPLVDGGMTTDAVTEDTLAATIEEPTNSKGTPDTGIRAVGPIACVAILAVGVMLMTRKSN